MLLIHKIRYMYLSSSLPFALYWSRNMNLPIFILECSSSSFIHVYPNHSNNDKNVNFCNFVLASEGSDWAKEVSDWPSAVAVPPSSTGTSDFSGQKLETVIEKLGFSEYLPLFKVYIK